MKPDLFIVAVFGENDQVVAAIPQSEAKKVPLSVATLYNKHYNEWNKYHTLVIEVVYVKRKEPGQRIFEASLTTPYIDLEKKVQEVLQRFMDLEEDSPPSI